MKVKYILTAEVVLDIDMANFTQAADEDDASEQLLAEFQDQPEEVLNKAKDEGTVTVTGKALKVVAG